MGRSYGDSALAPYAFITRRLDHVTMFDQDTGILECQAGVTLDDLLRIFLPRGWLPPVLPGTRYVTVGGAVASDIHGKNHHHDGCFSDHVLFFDLMLADGTIARCSPKKNKELFRATCGGMGLTGLILNVAMQLRGITGSMMSMSTRKSAGLAATFELFEEHADASYSVAWTDCLQRGRNMGRSIVFLGEHADDDRLLSQDRKPKRLPVFLAAPLLNRASVSLFNSFYYNVRRSRRDNESVGLYDYFFPLDGIRDWNRLYGRRGFIQYQCVIPLASGRQGISAILMRVADSGMGSFLSVLKRMGPSNRNYLSFPIEGYTLAVDFKYAPRLLEFLDSLDAIVLDFGGRVYLAKDSRLSEATFKASYPDWTKFAAVRSSTGAEGVFSSLQSQRLGI